MNQSSEGKNNARALLFNTLNNKKYLICEDEVSIGRNPSCVICVQDVLVSRKHCVIKRLPETCSFTIEDLSCHGTQLNGNQLMRNKVYPLNHRDTIKLSAVEDFTYEFLINRKYESALEQTKALNSNLEEKLIDLDSTHLDNMKKLTEQINHFKKERNLLNEELNSRLSAQENYFKQERDSLSNLLSSSNEQKVEAEGKIKEMEATFAAEKSILLQENENKLKEVAEREEELKKSKAELEERYQKDKIELEERYKVEVDELKEKLAESEQVKDRLKEENLEAEQKLKETKQTLLESELEQFRLHQEKVAVESKLESKIVDLTQESTSKEEMVKMLENKLKEKEKEEEFIKKEMENLEEEIICSICTELYIEPIVLNCGHMFCQLCIDEWKAKKKSCPMCRMKIKTCIRIHTIDSIINRSVKLMSSELQKRRQDIIKERSGGSKEEPVVPSKRRKTGPNEQADAYFGNVVDMMLDVASARFGYPIRAATNQYVSVSGLPPQATVPTLAPVPGPSTSATIPAPEPDPFEWHGMRRPTPVAHNRTESPVTVAAIDLTNLAPPVAHPRRRRNATSTATSGANTTIDLTTP